MASTEQQSKFDAVRQTLRRDWRNDNAILEQYFVACVENWKIYKGERTPKQVIRLNAIYRQATMGDTTWVKTESSTKKEIEREFEWYRLKGMPTDMAKRRYITFLAEIHPLLIDVMPSEKPPPGFPTDKKGRIICAKCNTVVGCQRPILDMHKGQLRIQLLENESLHEAEKVRQFVDEAMKGHQCMWGVHTYIHRADAKPFMEWFNLSENQGFQPYDYSPLFSIVKDLVTYHYELAWDMQQHKAEYSVDDMNAQLIRTKELKIYYEQLSGTEFFFNIPCTRDNDICNSRRLGEKGVNHSHPVELDEPTFRKATFEDLIRLRQQCVDLGIKPQIGVETDIGKRCKIYQERILEHFERLKKAVEAKKRNDTRCEVHKKEKADILRASLEMSKLQVSEASNTLSLSAIDNLIKKGCNLNAESTRGQTALVAMALCGAPTEMFVRAMQAGAEVEYCNKWGYTALMVACRRRDAAVLHALLKNGASPMTSDHIRKQTALHICAYYGLETEAQILYDYVKEGAGDSLKVISFLNAKDKKGDTSLIIAARRRNGLMCKYLLSLGADPGARNLQGRTAATAARDSGWVELAEWLGTKVGGGIKKVETVSDQSMERRMRFGMMTVRDKIRDFVQQYITLLYGSNFAQHVNTCPLGTPAWVQELNNEKISLQKQFKKLVEAQYSYIYVPVAEHRYETIRRERATKEVEENRNLNPSKPPPESLSRSVTSLNKINWAPEVAELRLICREILAVIQKGDAAPDTEGNKPRPWTPMMCAAAINDTDTMKRLLREGSDINCGNKSGTTPLMLAAQLNVVDSVAFLLQNGADLEQVDMHGFPAISYATSLPLPEELAESLSSYISDGDTAFERRLNAEKLLKLAARYGNKGLNSVLDENVMETGAAEKAEWVRYHSLLESHGLSRIETNWQLLNSIKNAGNRLNCAANETFQTDNIAESDSETESEIAEKEAYMAILEQKRIERERKAELESLRCPICTLQTPCPHFLNPNTLKKLIDGGYKPPPKVTIIRDGSILTKKQIAFLTERVLKESGLNDRKMDRTLDTLRAYQKRIAELNKAKRALLLEAAEHATSAENEAVAIHEINLSHSAQRRGALSAVAIAQDLVTHEWRQEIDDYGRITFINKLTGDTWSMHISIEQGDAKAYYYNAATDQTQWHPPGSLSGLSMEVLSRSFEGSESSSVAIEPSSMDSALPLLDMPSSDGVKPKKKKKKGGVKFTFEDDVNTFNADVPTDTLNKSSESIEMPKTGPIEEPTESLHCAMQPEAGNSITVAISDHVTQSDILVSALKSNGGDASKKKKRRVGGIRFNDDDGDKDAIKIEIRTIEPANFDHAESIKNGFTGDIEGNSSHVQVADAEPTDKSGTEALPIILNVNCGGDVATEDHPVREDGAVSSKSLDNVEDINDPHIKETAKTPILSIEESIRVPVQPLPPKERKVFSFTKHTSLGVSFVDGVIPSEVIPALRPYLERRHTTAVALSNQPLSSKKNKLEYPVLVSGWMFSGIAVPVSHPSVIVRGDSDVFESWRQNDDSSFAIFHNERKKIAADMQVAPVDSVNVSIESWGLVLEYLRGIFMDDFLPVVEFQSVVNPKNWKVSKARCPLCRLGVIRLKNDETNTEVPTAMMTLLGSYCITCAARCVLYNKIRTCTPRSQKARLGKDWPLYVPPEHFPLLPGDESPILHTLSASNLDILGSTLDISVPVSPKVDKYDVSALLIAPQSSLSHVGSRGFIRKTSPAKDPSTSKSPERVMTPAHAVVKKMLQRDEPDSDEEVNDSPSYHSPPKRKSRFLSKTIGNDKKISQKSLHSQSMNEMPSFMKNFTMSNIAPDNVFHVAEPEPEPVPDMNLETRYGPQELALIPFLIAKGQYDEAERLLRVAMCLDDMLGDAGAVHTVQILLFQADMYMLLDLFPLALGLFLDSIDILASSIGMEDAIFIESVYKLLSCSRKMGLSEKHINQYVSALCKNLEGSKITSKQAMVDSVYKMEFRSQKNQAEMKKVFVLLREHDALLHSNSIHRQLVSSIKGLVSFISIFESPNGLASAARVLFVQYCCDTELSAFDSTTNSSTNYALKTYGPIAQFVIACCRMRQCQDGEVYRFLAQNLVQKYLSKHENVIGNLVKDSDTIVNEIRLHVSEVAEKTGKVVNIGVFDPLLKRCILHLYPLYLDFLRTTPSAKRLIIYDFLDCEAEYIFISVVLIQSFWRQKYMKWQVSRRRANRNILKMLANSGSFVVETEPPVLAKDEI